MYSPETKARLDLLRQRSLSGEITMEERREALALLRDGRISAAQSAKAAKSAASKAAKQPQADVDLDSMFD